MNGIKRTKIPRPLKYPSVRLKCWVGIAGCKNTHHPAEDVASFTARQQKSTIHVIPEKTETTNPLKKAQSTSSQKQKLRIHYRRLISSASSVSNRGLGLQDVKRFIIQRRM
jgi:hypothetical protein